MDDITLATPLWCSHLTVSGKQCMRRAHGEVNLKSHCYLHSPERRKACSRPITERSRESFQWQETARFTQREKRVYFPQQSRTGLYK